MIKFYNTTRKASKSYKCNMCENDIQPSQRYVHWKSVGMDDDGEFFHNVDRLHVECQSKIDKETEEMIDEVSDYAWEHRYP